MPSIATTAIVHSERYPSDLIVGDWTRIGADVVIGRGCRIGDNVKIESHVTIGERNVIESGAVIKSGTAIGSNNAIHEYCVIGGAPLIANYSDVGGRLRIGSSNVIREATTIQVGASESGVTVIGDHNFIMPNVQVGHDSQLGDHLTLTNYTALCGHVIVKDRATLGVSVIVHQHCRIGEFAMVGASAYVSQDVPPFVLVDGRTGGVVGLNRVGLTRNGFDAAELSALKHAYRVLYRYEFTNDKVAAELESLDCKHADVMSAFVRQSERGIVQERRKQTSAVRPTSAENNDDYRATILKFRRAA